MDDNDQLIKDINAQDFTTEPTGEYGAVDEKPYVLDTAEEEMPEAAPEVVPEEAPIDPEMSRRMEEALNEDTAGQFNPNDNTVVRGVELPVEQPQAAPVEPPISLREPSAPVTEPVVPVAEPVAPVAEPAAPAVPVAEPVAESAAQPAVPENAQNNVAMPKKKSNVSTIVLLIILVLMIGGAVAALFIFKPWDNGGKTAGGSSSQGDDSNKVATRLIGNETSGYISIPNDWTVFGDSVTSDENAVYASPDGNYYAGLSYYYKTDSYEYSSAKNAAEDYARSMSYYSAQLDTRKVAGEYDGYVVYWYESGEDKWCYFTFFETGSDYIYIIQLASTDETSEYLTSIPDSWTATNGEQSTTSSSSASASDSAAAILEIDDDSVNDIVDEDLDFE